MDESRYRCTVVAADGVSRRVRHAGLVIGRDPACDIVIDDPSVSRRHALIRTSADGVELVSLGRIAVQHNGRPCERSQLLSDGDVITVNDVSFTVKLELPRPSRTSSGYRLVAGRSSYGISHTPFAIGGGEADDLILDAWPQRAVQFHLAQGGLFAEAHIADILRNGEPLELDMLEELAIGDVLAHLGTQFEIQRGVEQAQTTVVGDREALPLRVTIEMLPRGGRVVFTMPTGEHVVYLAERRLDLITALVRPPAEYAPGDYIPDEVLRPIVWPRNPNVIRSEINVHLTRCRKDLLAAGLAGPRLIQRSPGGGATRLALAPGCTIEFL